MRARATGAGAVEPAVLVVVAEELMLAVMFRCSPRGFARRRGRGAHGRGCPVSGPSQDRHNRHNQCRVSGGGAPARPIWRADLMWMTLPQLGSFRSVRGSRGIEVSSIYE